MQNLFRRCHAGALLGAMVMMSSLFAIQGSLLTNIIDFYRLNDSAQGMASSATFAGGVVALVASFFLMGRLPKLLLLRLAMALSFASLILLYFAPSYNAFVAIWFVTGIGLGFMDTLLSACIADIYTGKDATRMMCVLHMCFGLSSMISPLIFTAMMNSGIPWNQVYFYVAGTGAALLIFACFIFSRSGLGRETSLSGDHVDVKEMLRMLKTGPMILLAAAMFFHGMFLSGMNTWINRYVGVTLASDLGTKAMSFLFFGVMISRLLFPVLRIPTRTFVRYGCILAGVAVLAGILSGNGLVMCICVCICGVAFGAMIPCLLSIACAATPENTFFATTTLMLAYYIGQSIISPLIGALEASLSLHAGIAFCAVCMVITSLICIFNKHIGKDV